MNMLTKENSRTEMEQVALNQIMSQKNEFTVKDIMIALRAICDDDVEMEKIEEVVFNALDYCLSSGIIDIYNEFSYMVDPVKQIAYENSQNPFVTA